MRQRASFRLTVSGHLLDLGLQVKTDIGTKNKTLTFRTAVMIPECPRTTESRSRIRCESGQNRSGLLHEIRTAIRSEPFTEHYDVIPGKELGR